MIFVGPDALIGPLGGSFHRENFAACGRRESSALRGGFLSQRWERNQRIAGGRRRGELRSPMTAYPRSPVTGVTPWVGQNISGAQNLSDVLNFRRATGPWVCGKLWRMRFHRRAWTCRANGTGPISAVGAAPCGRPSQGGCLCRAGACPRRRRGIRRLCRARPPGRAARSPAKRRRGGYQPPAAIHGVSVRPAR